MQILHRSPGLGGEGFGAAVAEPDGANGGGQAGLHIVLIVADHPSMVLFDIEPPAGFKQRGGVGFEFAIFAGDQDLKLEAVAFADGIDTGAAVAGDDGDRDLVSIQPGEDFFAAGIED